MTPGTITTLHNDYSSTMENPLENTSLNNFLSQEDLTLTKAEQDLRKYELELERYRDYSHFRKTWSMAILGFVIVILCINILFIFFMGFNVWHFQDEWIPRIIFSGNFLEILGLAKIVVDFLFPNPQKFLSIQQTSPTPTISNNSHQET